MLSSTMYIPLVSKVLGVGCPGKLTIFIQEFVLRFDFSGLASMTCMLHAVSLFSMPHEEKPPIEELKERQQVVS